MRSTRIINSPYCEARSPPIWVCENCEFNVKDPALATEHRKKTGHKIQKNVWNCSRDKEHGGGHRWLLEGVKVITTFDKTTGVLEIR